MTDLISRADAIGTVLTYFIPRSHTGERGEHEEDFVRTIFKELPSAEAVQVVRCKDCRYCTEYYDRDGYPYWICDEWDSGTDADGFCHYGERKEP